MVFGHRIDGITTTAILTQKVLKNYIHYSWKLPLKIDKMNKLDTENKWEFLKPYCDFQIGNCCAVVIGMAIGVALAIIWIIHDINN